MDKEYIVTEVERLDKYLAKVLHISRNQIENLIKKEAVCIDGTICLKSGLKLKIDQTISIKTIEADETKSGFDDESLKKLDIKIIFENEHFLILHKPIGVTVHPAPSVKEATLVDWLKYKNIRLSTLSGEERHGIVHRLDKGTSGLLVVAKTNEAHQNLAMQLEDKSMGRYYLALIDLPLKDDCIVDKPIARNRSNRLKMGIVADGKSAKTAFKKLLVSSETNHNYELIAAKLFTGRTHQIRVHLESIGRHIVGDTLYGFKSKSDNIERIFLHAYSLYLNDPITQEPLQFICDIPKDFEEILKRYFNKGEIDEKINTKHIVNSFNNVDQWM